MHVRLFRTQTRDPAAAQNVLRHQESHPLHNQGVATNRKKKQVSRHDCDRKTREDFCQISVRILLILPWQETRNYFLLYLNKNKNKSKFSVSVLRHFQRIIIV